MILKLSLVTNSVWSSINASCESVLQGKSIEHVANELLWIDRCVYSYVFMYGHIPDIVTFMLYHKNTSTPTIILTNPIFIIHRDSTCVNLDLIRMYVSAMIATAEYIVSMLRN